MHAAIYTLFMIALPVSSEMTDLKRPRFIQFILIPVVILIPGTVLIRIRIDEAIPIPVAVLVGIWVNEATPIAITIRFSRTVQWRGTVFRLIAIPVLRPVASPQHILSAIGIRARSTGPRDRLRRAA